MLQKRAWWLKQGLCLELYVIAQSTTFTTSGKDFYCLLMRVLFATLFSDYLEHKTQTQKQSQMIKLKKKTYTKSVSLATTNCRTSSTKQNIKKLHTMLGKFDLSNIVLGEITPLETFHFYLRQFFQFKFWDHYLAGH